MQTTKEHTRRLLQDTAREAFLRKGFKAVSMREISRLSGVGLSNIYNYYPCKDDLLAIVLRPLLGAMTNIMENHNSDKNLSLEIFIARSLGCYFSILEIHDLKTIGSDGLIKVR